MQGRSADVIVVGAGIVGLSTAYALEQRGVDFRIFEAARPGAGQSAGRTRIFRHAHRRPELVRDAAASRAIWEDWQARLGVTLIGRQGLVVAGSHAPELEALLTVGASARRFRRSELRSGRPIFGTTCRNG